LPQMAPPRKQREWFRYGMTVQSGRLAMRAPRVFKVGTVP
jgi:hypothetical protein